MGHTTSVVICSRGRPSLHLDAAPSVLAGNLPEVAAVKRAWRRADLMSKLKYFDYRGHGGFYLKLISNGDWFTVRRFAAVAPNHLVRAAIRVTRARLREARGDLASTWGLLMRAFRWLRAR